MMAAAKVSGSKAIVEFTSAQLTGESTSRRYSMHPRVPIRIYAEEEQLDLLTFGAVCAHEDATQVVINRSLSGTSLLSSSIPFPTDVELPKLDVHRPQESAGTKVLGRQAMSLLA